MQIPPPCDLVRLGSATDLAQLYPRDFFDCVMGSPPYMLCRDYGEEDIAMALSEWVSFMETVTLAALDVCKGPVIWVVAGTGSSNYIPGPEMLLARMYGQKGVNILRPNIWAKNSPPTGKGWFSNDWEYCLAFAKKVPIPTWTPEELKEALKYTSGGSFRQRKKSGERSAGSSYPQHQFRKRPSNVNWADFDHEAKDDWDSQLHYVPVGGGLLGWKDCHLNEAPYPEQLVARHLKAVTKPGDKVLDPFCGSGTTLDVAFQLDRIGYGVDIRQSQVDLTLRRLHEMHPQLDKTNG